MASLRCVSDQFYTARTFQSGRHKWCPYGASAAHFTRRAPSNLVAINGAPTVHLRSCRVRIDAHRQCAPSYLVAINGAPTVHLRSCRVRIFVSGRHKWRPCNASAVLQVAHSCAPAAHTLKIDPGYEKRLQLAGTLADRDHIFYHVRNLACSGEHRAFPFRHAAGGV